MRSSVEKKVSTRGIRKYGTVRKDNSSSESCCPRHPSKEGRFLMCSTSSSVVISWGAARLEGSEAEG